MELVDNTGNVWWPKPDEYVLGTNYTLSKVVITIRPHKTAHIMVTDIEVYQNTTFYLKVSGVIMAMAYVEVKPATVSKAFMECSNLKLSANKGDLTLNMKCNVYFTNPTGVQWNITRIDAEAHVLKTPHTKDLTIEPTKTIITHTIPPGGVGEFELEFHDVLPQNGFIETGLELEDLAGAKVPVQVNFTVYANDHPYVKTSQGILDLSYAATQYVEIEINKQKVMEHLAVSVSVGVTAGAVTAYILECTETGAAIGSAVPGGGTLVGATVGFIFGVVTYKILGLP